jgi:O-antigen biosynthesis protein
MRLALIFDRTRSDTTGVYFERAFQALGVETTHVSVAESRRMPRDYDVYVRIDHGDYAEDIPEDMHPSLFYVIDTHLPASLKRMRSQAQHYDWICCAQHDAVQLFSRASWVPLACDPGVHGGSIQAQQYDIAFVGTEGGIPRKFYLQEIRERYPKSYIGHASYTSMGDIYRASGMIFNYAIRNDINMRVFEALCAGRCLMTNTIYGNGWRELFTDRTHLVEYRTPEQLWEVLRYFQQHPDMRDAIGRQGQALALAGHTYVHRAQQIVDLCASQLGVATATIRGQTTEQPEVSGSCTS